MENEVNTNNPQQNNNQGNYNANPYLDAQIAKQKKYFYWYSRIPLIIAIIILALSFIMGVIAAAILYFWAWLIGMVIGGVIAAIEYFIGKIIYSQKILTVLYLQKLNEKK